MVKPDHRVRAVTFEYHGIARAEVAAARSVGEAAKVAEHRFVRLPDLREAADIPGARFPGMPSTYIPMRNSILYSFAASMAEETGARVIVGGHNRDDEAVFRDVSASFFASLERALWAGSAVLSGNRTRIYRPLRLMQKAEVMKTAASLHVPLELTWSCHRDGKVHCWKCEGCTGRTDAFRAAGVPDPLLPKRARKIT